MGVGRGLSGSVRGARSDKAPNCHQERKVSKDRKQIVKKMKKEIGMTPYGNLQPYSTTELPDGLAIRLNCRERESLDIQYGLLEVTWLGLVLVGWVTEICGESRIRANGECFGVQYTQYSIVES